jgi:hypothetical protein
MSSVRRFNGIKVVGRVGMRHLPEASSVAIVDKPADTRKERL